MIEKRVQKLIDELRKEIKARYHKEGGVCIALSCVDHIDFMLEASRDEMKEEVK